MVRNSDGKEVGVGGAAGSEVIKELPKDIDGIKALVSVPTHNVDLSWNFTIKNVDQIKNCSISPNKCHQFHILHV